MGVRSGHRATGAGAVAVAASGMQQHHRQQPLLVTLGGTGVSRGFARGARRRRRATVVRSGMRTGSRGGVALRTAAFASSDERNGEAGREEESSSGSGSEGAGGGGDCPYTAAKEAVSGMLPRAKPIPPGGPPMLPSQVFLKSIIKAGSSPVGMPEAMLEWVELTGHETIGIKNFVGPLCVSTVDPDVVEYVCHTNAKNYRLRMLPDAFRYVIKNKAGRRSMFPSLVVVATVVDAVVTARVLLSLKSNEPIKMNE